MSVYTTSPDGWMQSNAGGLRWMTHDDGTIEIEGQGIIVAPTTGYFADGKFIDPVFAQWGDKIYSWSSTNGVSPAWTGAITIIESRGKNYPANSAGAGGLMALLQSTMNTELGHPGNLHDPDDSFNAGTRFLAQLSQKYGGQLPAVAPSYNAGSAIPSLQSKCNSTINGKWQHDGTSAQNSMGFVEDCSNGHSSAYAIRAVGLNNSIILAGLGGGSGVASGGSTPGVPTSLARSATMGLLGGAGLAIGVTLAEEMGWIKRLFRW